MMTKMVNRERQRPGGAVGSRARGRIRGRRLAFIGSYNRTSRYASVGLAVLAFGAILIAGVVGCRAMGTGYGRMGETSGRFMSGRSAAGEVSRLLRNAHYYKLMGQPELALKELEQAHQQNPDNLGIVNALARNYEEVGMFEDARKLYEKALSRHGPHPTLANNLCFSYYQEGRWEEAENCFRRALAQNPQNVSARNNLGLLYCRLGRLDEARRLWQGAEGVAAADDKVGQALASLGIKDSRVYAQGSKPVPSLQPKASTPVKAAASSPAPTPSLSKVQPPVEPVTSKKAVRRLAAKPVQATSSPSRPQPPAEGRKQAAVADKVQPVESPAPSPQAAPRPRPAPLTCAELLGTAIEVRNGTPAPDLARRTRTLLNQEGFTVSGIGNHLDFGADRTIIYYRSGAERVAQSLRDNFFPTANLEQTSTLKDRADIKVLLGHDFLEQPPVMARLDGKNLSPATSPLMPVKSAAAPTPANSPPAGNPASQAASPDKAQPDGQLSAPKSSTSVAQTQSSCVPDSLSRADLRNNAIDVRNGTGTPNLAHQTRSLLNQEGFTVARIGNHRDFGARKTIIFYRPDAKKVAGALRNKFFRGASLEPSTKLNGKAAVKILLGADLLKRPQLMTRLAAGETE